MGSNTKEVQKKADAKRAGARTRNWSFLVYPESMPDNWIEIIKEERVPFVVSPLHDSDISNANTGELKKAHYHVVITYNSIKTYEQVKQLTDSLNAPIPQQCKSIVGSVRYFIHLDDADKYQYNKEDIQAFNGFDLEKCFPVSATDRYQAIGDMMVYIVKEDIREFSKLSLYAKFNNQEWFKLLCDNSTLFIGQFIKSRRHQSDEERLLERDMVLRELGELE
jgi:hypothetical protein